MSLYDAIARLYDPWSRSVTEDVSFYVEETSPLRPMQLVRTPGFRRNVAPVL